MLIIDRQLTPTLITHNQDYIDFIKDFDMNMLLLVHSKYWNLFEEIDKAEKRNNFDFVHINRLMYLQVLKHLAIIMWTEHYLRKNDTVVFDWYTEYNIEQWRKKMYKKNIPFAEIMLFFGIDIVRKTMTMEVDERVYDWLYNTCNYLNS